MLPQKSKNAPTFPRLRSTTTLGELTAIQIYTHAVWGWERNKTGLKFVNLLSCWSCLAVSGPYWK